MNDADFKAKKFQRRWVRFETAVKANDLVCRKIQVVCIIYLAFTEKLLGFTIGHIP